MLLNICVVTSVFYIAQLSRPMSLHSDFLPNNLTSVVLEWDAFTETTCSRNTVSYTIDIDGVPIPPERIAVLSSYRHLVSGLQPNRRYMATVRAVITNCMSDASNLEFQIVAESELSYSYLLTILLVW